MAILTSAEDLPDLSSKELIAKQEEMIRDFERQTNTSVRGGRRARGDKKDRIRGERGRTLTSTQSARRTQRQARPSGIRIEKVTEEPQIPKILIAHKHLQA